MKRTVPLLITAIAGFVLIISFFLPAIQEWGEIAAIWFDILASIAFILGGGNLLKLHLKAMSDKGAGWGYSAVTIIAFVLTLAFGLLKVGSPPTAKVEFYGETFVEFPLAAMPEYKVAGTLPERADHEPFPASVRTQLREENGQLIFQGWMNEDQKNDLFKYKPTLDWQCRVEQLFDASQPKKLDGKIKYYPDHSSLAVQGPLTEGLNKELTQILPESNVSKNVLKKLADRSNRKTILSAGFIPDAFEIPDEELGVLSRTGNEITITGPMTAGFREEMVRIWSGFEPARPLTDIQEAELFTELEARGSNLSPEQIEVFEKFFAAEWDANSLIAALNTAAIPSDEPKAACALLEERDAGVKELVAILPAPEPVLLNGKQEDAVKEFIEHPEQTPEELAAQLSTFGTFSEKQLKEISKFIDKLPRQAEELKSLGLKLIAVGPLSEEQRDYLFQPAAELYAWKTEVNELFLASHQVKYAWSGDYSAQGNPFWWIYEYVLQPLMTTTFAVLAFYVASAAFRAFRAKNLEATLLLGTAFIVLLGRTYLGVQLTAWVPDAFSAFKIDQMIVYIMKIFNTAGNRAIMIGIALGIASTSLKVLLGIDRSYLGSSDD